mgnify:CR=1 FL=1
MPGCDAARGLAHGDRHFPKPSSISGGSHGVFALLVYVCGRACRCGLAESVNAACMYARRGPELNATPRTAATPLPLPRHGPLSPPNTSRQALPITLALPYLTLPGPRSEDMLDEHDDVKAALLSFARRRPDILFSLPEDKVREGMAPTAAAAVAATAAAALAAALAAVAVAAAAAGVLGRWGQACEPQPVGGGGVWVAERGPYNLLVASLFYHAFTR